MQRKIFNKIMQLSSNREINFMNKYLMVLFTVISGFCFGQLTRFIYQVSMKTDSTSAPILEMPTSMFQGVVQYFTAKKRLCEIL